MNGGITGHQLSNLWLYSGSQHCEGKMRCKNLDQSAIVKLWNSCWKTRKRKIHHYWAVWQALQNECSQIIIYIAYWTHYLTPLVTACRQGLQLSQRRWMRDLSSTVIERIYINYQRLQRPMYLWDILIFWDLKQTLCTKRKPMADIGKITDH